MQEEQNIQKIDLVQLIYSGLRRIRHTWYLGLLIILACAAIGGIREKLSYTPMYKVHASFVVNATGSEQVTANYTNKETAKQLNETFPYILTSGALGKIVANDLGYETLPARVSAEALGDVNLFRISVTGTDPNVCMAVLNSIIVNYPEVAKYILGSTTLDLVNMSKIPKNPYNTLDIKHGAFRFGVIGLLIYLATVVINSLFNRTVHSKAMLQKFVSVKVFGSIPRIGSKNKKKHTPIQIASGGVSGLYREALEAIRVRIISKMRQNNWKTMYITSSMASEGKTTITCNLAVLMAQHGHTVLLIDGDLRNPSVSRTLGLEREKGAPGMNEFLNGDAKLDTVLVRSEIPTLLVIPGGEAIERISNQFNNGRFEKLINTFRDKVDIILVDTPPCAMLDDTAMIAEYLEGGFLVVHKDYTSIDAVIAGCELMSKTKAPLFGCALNFGEDRE